MIFKILPTRWQRAPAFRGLNEHRYDKRFFYSGNTGRFLRAFHACDYNVVKDFLSPVPLFSTDSGFLRHYNSTYPFTTKLAGALRTMDNFIQGLHGIVKKVTFLRREA
jgi:hypothetical protein